MEAPKTYTIAVSIPRLIENTECYEVVSIIHNKQLAAQVVHWITTNLQAGYVDYNISDNSIHLRVQTSDHLAATQIYNHIAGLN